MGFIPEIELVSLEEQVLYQCKKLNELLLYLKSKSPFYQRHLSQQVSISSIKDLEQLPTTSKEDLQVYNSDFICVPYNEIKEYTSTSGTLGNPVTIALTQSDIERLTYNEYLSFELMELTQSDIVQFMLTLDKQFMAGMAYYLGLQKHGAAGVRTGPGLPAMQLNTIKRLGSSVLVSVPSFLLKLIECAQQSNIDLHNLHIKKVLCIGESIRKSDFELNALASRIQQHWNLQLFSTYASSEMQTAFTECKHGKGGHAHPSLIVLEIVDDEGKQLMPGEYGEVCITTLGVEAMPLLRYRTGDICCYYDEPCVCGRKTLRLSPVKGRKKQMIKYKGTTIYPPTIIDALHHCEYIDDFVVELKSDEFGNDDLILHLVCNGMTETCDAVLKPLLQTYLRVIPTIQYVSVESVRSMQFPNGNRKALKFIDQRKTD